MNRQAARRLHLRGRTRVCPGDGTLSEALFGFLVARGRKGKERAGRRSALRGHASVPVTGAGSLDLPGIGVGGLGNG